VLIYIELAVSLTASAGSLVGSSSCFSPGFSRSIVGVAGLGFDTPASDGGVVSGGRQLLLKFCGFYSLVQPVYQYAGSSGIFMLLRDTGQISQLVCSYALA